jgi:hypothetical protein
MRILRLLAFAAFCAAVSGFAQHATLTADNATLAPSGGTVALTATVSYEGEPGAVGWAIALPADWTLVSVSGPNVPSIAPDAGSTGTLEFAYTNVPSGRAAFTVLVRYPAKSAAAKATPTVLLRSGGILTTLTPPAVELSAVK